MLRLPYFLAFAAITAAAVAADPAVIDINTLRAQMRFSVTELDVAPGAPVKILYVTSGIRISVDGVAQGDAAKGEAVRVLNNYTKRSIDAVASGEGEARVAER